MARKYHTVYISRSFTIPGTKTEQKKEYKEGQRQAFSDKAQAVAFWKANNTNTLYMGKV